MTFSQWIESDDGKKSADYSTLTGAKYLHNRLWWAFNAGLGAAESILEAPSENGISPKIDRLQKTLEWYEERNKKLLDRIKELESQIGN